MSTRACIALLFALSGPPAFGADGGLPLGAAALTHHHDGKIQGCGIRVTGGRTAVKTRSVWVDFSFNVYASGEALVQATGYEMPPPDYEAQSWPERMWIQRAWIRPRTARSLARLGENAQAREELVYAITLEEAAGLFEAVAASRPLALGIHGWGEAREQVIEGVAELGGEARGEIETCLAALVNSFGR